MLTQTKTTLFVILFLALITPLFAQYSLWEPEEGLTVRQGETITSYCMRAAADNDGNILYTWTERSEAGYANLRAQFITMDGVPQWGNGGVRISHSNGEDAEQVIQYLGEGEWLIVWNRETEEYTHSQIIAQILDENGNTTWEGDGLVICDGEWYRCNPTITMSGDNTIIGWTDWRFGEPLDYHDDFRCSVFIQILDENRQPVLANDGMDVFPDQEFECQPVPNVAIKSKIRCSDNYIFVQGWDYLQKLDTSGSFYWREALNNRYMVDFEPIADGEFLVLEGEDAYYSDEVRMQRYDSEGNAQWEEIIIAEDVTDGTMYKDNNGNIIVSYFLPPGDFYFQKFSIADNSPQPLWGDQPGVGIGLYGVYVDHQFIDMNGFHIDENGMIRISQRARYYVEGSPRFTQLLFQSITPAGEKLVNNSQGLMFNDYPSVKDQNVTVQLPDGETGVLWIDERYYEAGFYFQRLNSNGEPQLVEDGVLVDRIVKRGAGHVITVADDKSVYTGWINKADEFDYGIVSVQKIDCLDGQCYWQDQGLPVWPSCDNMPYDTTYNKMESWQMVSDHHDGIFLAGAAETACAGGNDYLRLQHLSSTGEYLFGRAGTILDTAMYYTFSYLAMDNLGGEYSYIAYNGETSEETGQFVLQRFNGAGEAEWADGSSDRIVILEESQQSEPHLFMQDDGSVIVFYIRDLNPDIIHSYHYQAQRFNAERQAMWDEPLDLGLASLWYNPIYVARFMDDLLVFRVEKNEESNEYTLKGQRLTPTGEYAWEEWIEISTFDTNLSCSYYWSVDLVVNEDTFWLVYHDHANLFASLLDEDGTILVEDVVVPVADYTRFDAQPAAVLDQEGGIYIAWGEKNTLDTYPFRWIHIDADGNYVQPDYANQPNTITRSLPETLQWGWHYTVSKVMGIALDSQNGFVAIWADQLQNFDDFQEHSSLKAQRFCDAPVQSVHDSQSLTPGTFSLSPAYPNPFNPVTQLGFTLPTAGHVTLSVYDVLGREVARLVDGHLTAGKHTVQWDATASPVASGTYFCRLEADERTAIQKLILLK